MEEVVFVINFDLIREELSRFIWKVFGTVIFVDFKRSP